MPLPENWLYSKIRNMRPCGSVVRSGVPEKALLLRPKSELAPDSPWGSIVRLANPPRPKPCQSICQTLPFRHRTPCQLHAGVAGRHDGGLFVMSRDSDSKELRSSDGVARTATYIVQKNMTRRNVRRSIFLNVLKDNVNAERLFCYNEKKKNICLYRTMEPHTVNKSPKGDAALR